MIIITTTRYNTLISFLFLKLVQLRIDKKCLIVMYAKDSFIKEYIIIIIECLVYKYDL